MLAEKNPYVYRDALGISCNNYVIILIHKKEFDEAEKYYRDTMDLYVALNQTCPGMYLRNIRWVYSNLEKLKRKMG